jgi:hypothetical protein
MRSLTAYLCAIHTESSGEASEKREDILLVLVLVLVLSPGCEL